MVYERRDDNIDIVSKGKRIEKNKGEIEALEGDEIWMILATSLMGLTGSAPRMW